MQWHQLDHMQTISTSLQTDSHTSSSSQVVTGRMLFLTPNRVKALKVQRTNTVQDKLRDASNEQHELDSFYL